MRGKPNKMRAEYHRHPHLLSFIPQPSSLLTFVALLALPLSVRAQTAPAAAPTQKLGFSFQPEWRPRFEKHETTDFDAADASDPRDSQSRLRLGLRWKDRAGWSAFLQPQFTWYDDRGYSRRTGTHYDLDIHQGYADIPAAYGKWRLGRQEMLFGDGRLIGNSDWGPIGRSFDGVRLTLADRHTTTDLFATKLGQQWPKTSEPAFAGVYSRISRGKTAGADLYLLYKTGRISPTATQQVFTVGTRPHAAWRRFDATLEGAYQFGTTSGRAIDAYAFAAVAGYTLPGRADARLWVERDEASGGRPSGGGAYRTFDQLFPSNHMNYGLIDYVGWRNMKDLAVKARAIALPRLQLQAEGHWFALQNARDFWYGDGGKPNVGVGGKQLRDATGASGRDVGEELDLMATYALRPGVALSGGYARFFPGGFIRGANGGHADPSDWFYVQTNLSF